MDPVALTALGKLIESGLGWVVSVVLGYLLWKEIKDRRKCDGEMQTLLLSLKDESHTRVQAANDRQAESFAKVGDAMVALTTEV